MCHYSLTSELFSIFKHFSFLQFSVKICQYHIQGSHEPLQRSPLVCESLSSSKVTLCQPVSSITYWCQSLGVPPWSLYTHPMGWYGSSKHKVLNTLVVFRSASSSPPAAHSLPVCLPRPPPLLIHHLPRGPTPWAVPRCYRGGSNEVPALEDFVHTALFQPQRWCLLCVFLFSVA